MRKYILIFLISLQSSVFAGTDWFCSEESSQRRGNSFYVCGLGEADHEADARAGALSRAKAEFASLCGASDDCRGHRVVVEPGRTVCEAGKCYRLVVFTIEDAGMGGASDIGGKLKVGMAKADVLRILGAPIRAKYWEREGLHIYYSGKMCENNAGCYLIFDRDDEVKEMWHFNILYTNYLD